MPWLLSLVCTQSHCRSYHGYICCNTIFYLYMIFYPMILLFYPSIYIQCTGYISESLQLGDSPSPPPFTLFTYYSPMGFYFVTGSHDRTAQIWSTDQIHPLRILAGHLSDVDVRFLTLSTAHSISLKSVTCAMIFMAFG